MSHYTLFVAGTDLDSRMDHFDENRSVPAYIDKKAEWEATLKEARGFYLQWANDQQRNLPENVREGYRRLADPASDPAAVLRAWTDNDWQLRENGEGYDCWTTRNPDGFWDWFVIGGRWDKGLVTKDGQHVNETTAGELDLEHEDAAAPHAFLDLNNEWHQEGRMGWFGTCTADMKPEAWEQKWKAWVASLPAETPITLIDCHV